MDRPFKVGDKVVPVETDIPNRLYAGEQYIVTGVEERTDYLTEAEGERFMVKLEGEMHRVFEKRLKLAVPACPFEVGDKVTLVQEYYGIPEGTVCVISSARRLEYSSTTGRKFMFTIKGHHEYELFYEKRFKAYVEPEPIEVVIPKDVPATITATVTDDSGEQLYEHHVYNRHAESEQLSEGFFWDKVSAWGKASFYNGYTIALTLWINGSQRQDIKIKRGA